MSKSLAPLALAAATFAAAAPARAEGRLTAAVFTGSQAGFLVDSTLIAGDKDAILIDAQFDLADAHRLVATILETKKNLTTVYVTHLHPDHYFGLGVIHDAFPRARLVALPATVEEIRKTWQDKVKQWAPQYGDLVPTQPVLPVALAGGTLTLEGQTLEIHGGVQGDAEDSSYVWIPSIKTVVAGDIIYRGVHAWTRETTPAQRRAWRKTLDELAALRPTTVIAGHKDPRQKDDAGAIDATRAYLDAFDAAVASSKTSAEVQKKVKARFPTAQLDIILQLGADAAFPPR
ncbi:MAG TPA: MBL fold metallo-hydrolase [Kofleriaceae bacterium]|nr:MBL fold metallo-hydrolase [Kofleriaceae bacterium]